MNESDSEERPSHGLLLPPKAIDIQKLEPYDGVKIDLAELKKFIDHWRESQWPEGLLIKLLDNIRHIKPVDFELAVKEMADTIIAQQKNEYIFYTSQIKNKSGGFMLEKLNPYLNAAGKAPAAFLDLFYFHKNWGQSQILPVQIEKRLRKNEIDLLYIDDATYSGKGGQVDVSLDNLKKIGVTPERVKIYVVASTEISREQVKNKNRSFWSYYHVPTMLDEIFTSEEFQTLNKLSRPDEYHTPKGSHPGAVLTSFFYKVPDNHYGWILPSTPGKPYILNDRLTGPMNISPPYHK